MGRASISSSRLCSPGAGIRRLPIVQQILDSGIAMAGIATALTLEPQLIKPWRTGRDQWLIARRIRQYRAAMTQLSH